MDCCGLVSNKAGSQPDNRNRANNGEPWGLLERHCLFWRMDAASAAAGLSIQLFRARYPHAS